MTIELSKYGKEGMTNPKMGRRPTEGIHALSFDLSPIPRGAKVYHASLRMHAPLERIRTDKRAYMSIGQGHWYYDPLRLYAEMKPWKPIEIYVAKPGSAAGKAVYDKASLLRLEAPQYKSFDATAAVRDWASGRRANLGFVVRQLDLWDWWPSMTVLEVRYEGTPARGIAQAADVRAVHRNGQTFITWTEIAKTITADKVLWKPFETAFKKVSPRGSVFYRIYRSDRPITPENLAEAKLIDEIWPLSGYDGRMHEHMTRGEDWMGLNPAAYVPRYCIEPPPAGPLKPNDAYGGGPARQWGGRQLPPHAGLYVHQPAAARKSYYAVTALVNGVENTRDLTATNAPPDPVAEAAAPGEPILYRVLDQSKRQGRKPLLRETQFFVYWAAPPYANQPRRPVHLMVGLQDPAPASQTLIRYNIGDMYGSEINAGTHPYEWRKGKVIFSIADDAAFGSSQYWSSFNTLMSREQAKRHPYAKRITDLFKPWAEKLKRRLALAAP